MPWPVSSLITLRDESTTAPSVATTIQMSSKIATLPSVVIQIVRICEKPGATIDEVNDVFDPVLGMRIVKLVNSAYYGMSGQINSIKHAIVMVGLNAVKNIAIAASLVKLVRGGKVTPGFSARKLWMHSIAVATGARMLAQHSHLVTADEAFLAGMIHDMGIVVEMQVFHANFAQMIENLLGNQSLTFRAAEEEKLGASHEALGAELCKVWKFPESLQLATGYHHRPWELSEERRPLPAIVHLADILAARLKLGYSRTVETDLIDADLLECLQLTKADIRAVAATLPEAMDESQRLLVEH